MSWFGLTYILQGEKLEPLLHVIFNSKRFSLSQICNVDFPNGSWLQEESKWHGSPRIDLHHVSATNICPSSEQDKRLWLGNHTCSLLVSWNRRMSSITPMFLTRTFLVDLEGALIHERWNSTQGVQTSYEVHKRKTSLAVYFIVNELCAKPLNNTKNHHLCLQHILLKLNLKCMVQFHPRFLWTWEFWKGRKIVLSFLWLSFRSLNLVQFVLTFM